MPKTMGSLAQPGAIAKAGQVVWGSRRTRLTVRSVACAMAAAFILATGSTSIARAGSFNCESRGRGKTCLTVSGPNEGMEEGEGDNYTSPEFELIFFKYNSGSYVEIYSHLFHSYTGAHCYSSYFDGHLEVASNGAFDNLAGDQIDGCRS